MRTNITSDNGVEIEVCGLGIAVVNHEEETETWARLSDAQRVELAAALDPGRRGLHVRLDNQAKTLATFQRARDAAVARAEKAKQVIPPHAMLDVWVALGRDSIHFDDWYDEHGYAEAWAELTAAVREARTAPVVSRAEIEEQLRIAYESGNHPIERIRVATDAMCDLFGVEAEQAADPVEAKARELAKAGGIDFDEQEPEGVEMLIGMARHVLGQEATR